MIFYHNSSFKNFPLAGFYTVSRHCQARTADVGKVSALAFRQMSRSMRISSQLINPYSKNRKWGDLLTLSAKYIENPQFFAADFTCFLV